MQTNNTQQAFDEGDRVEVVTTFKSDGRSKTALTAGLRGTIGRIDKDGDASIGFEGITGKRLWVFKANFSNLKRIQSPGKPKSMQALIAGHWVHSELTGQVDTLGLEVEVMRKDTQKAAWVSRHLLKGITDAELKRFIADAMEWRRQQMKLKGSMTRGSWKQGDSVAVFSQSAQKWFTGTIRDITHDQDGEWLEISYTLDDGRLVLKQVAREDDEMVRPLPARDSQNEGSSEAFAPGDRVEGMFEMRFTRRAKWFAGTITTAKADGSYDVAWDDGTRGADFPRDRLRPAQGEAATPLSPWTCPKCTFANRLARSRCEICRTRKPPTRPTRFTRPPSTTPGAQGKAVTKVVQFTGKDWGITPTAFPWKVAKLSHNGQAKEHGVHIGWEIAQVNGKVVTTENKDQLWASVLSVGGNHAITFKFFKPAFVFEKEGQRIEALYKGNGRWYPGTVTKKNSDGTFAIKWDDGVVARNKDGAEIRGFDVNATRLNRTSVRDGTLKPGSVVVVKTSWDGLPVGTMGTILKIDRDGDIRVDFSPYNNNKLVVRTEFQNMEVEASDSEQDHVVTFENKPLGISISGRTVTGVDEGSQASEHQVKMGWKIKAINTEDATGKTQAEVMALIDSAKAAAAPTIRVTFTKPTNQGQDGIQGTWDISAENETPMIYKFRIEDDKLVGESSGTRLTGQLLGDGKAKFTEFWTKDDSKAGESMIMLVGETLVGMTTLEADGKQIRWTAKRVVKSGAKESQTTKFTGRKWGLYVQRQFPLLVEELRPDQSTQAYSSGIRVGAIVTHVDDIEVTKDNVEEMFDASFGQGGDHSIKWIQQVAPPKQKAPCNCPNCAAKKAAQRSGELRFTAGTKVEVVTDPSETCESERDWIAGVVKKVEDDGYRVTVRGRDYRRNADQVREPLQDSLGELTDAELIEGKEVSAYWHNSRIDASRFRGWHKGKIKQVEGDSYTIRFDDGYTRTLPRSHIKQLGMPKRAAPPSKPTRGPSTIMPDGTKQDALADSGLSSMARLLARMEKDESGVQRYTRKRLETARVLKRLELRMAQDGVQDKPTYSMNSLYYKIGGANRIAGAMLYKDLIRRGMPDDNSYVQFYRNTDGLWDIEALEQDGADVDGILPLIIGKEAFMGKEAASVGKQMSQDVN